ncbi:MAG TPA: hypothetical protein VF547_04950 [Allosphingosinicella sp.]
MDLEQDKVRNTLEGQIDDLVKARRASSDPKEKEALSSAISRLEREVDLLNLTAADALPAKVDAIVKSLQGVLQANSLDAVSALGRSIEKIEALTKQG